MIGYRPCKVCGAETNVVDLTAGLCSACKAERAEALAALQRKFDAAVLLWMKSQRIKKNGECA